MGRPGHIGTEVVGTAVAGGIQLEFSKLPEAKRGFMLLRLRWVVERSFALLARFRRFVRDYGRLPFVLACSHSSRSPGSCCIATSL